MSLHLVEYVGAGEIIELYIYISCFSAPFFGDKIEISRLIRFLICRVKRPLAS